MTGSVPNEASPALFARYAYPPNELGFCGPTDVAAYFAAAATGHDRRELRHLTQQFEGAWPYLELIARCSGICDPLDREVVKAYWIGNVLTTRVPPAVLASWCRHHFERRTSSHLSAVLATVAGGGLPQHSFHVFAVYPWFGLLRGGREGAPLEVLDRCRIRWGRVEAVYGDTVVVRSNPLRFVGSRLELGPERSETARRTIDGVGFVPELTTGDVVSLHWDWVCDCLSSVDRAWLQFCTRRNLAAVNALTVPGPALVCGV